MFKDVQGIQSGADSVTEVLPFCCKGVRGVQSCTDFQSAFTSQEVAVVVSSWLSTDFQNAGFTATFLQY